MNLFNFSFSPTSKQTQLTQILSTIKPNQDWMDVYTTLTTIVNILKSYPANADLPLSNLTRYLIQSSDMSLPLTVHGVVLDILTLLYQRLQKNEFDCYYFYLLPPLLLLSKTSLPQIRARCVDVFQQYIISVKPKNLKETSENDLSSNDTTNEKLTPINNFVSIIETLVVCFASGLLENMNNLHEKVSILFSTINYSYPKEFCCALVHHLHRSPTTRHGLLKFIVTKKYIFSVDYVNETKLCSAFVSLLHSNDLVIVKQTLDIINEQFPMSKKTVSESIRIVLLRGVLFLLIQKDTGVIQRVTNWVFGDSESFFKENSYNTFIGTVRSIVLKYLDNPVGNGICIDTICSLVSIKLFADAIITETAGLLMKLLVVMSSTSDSSKCQSITSLLSVVDLEIFKENLETLDPKDQVIFVIHYQPSEIQTPSLITTAEILFNKYIEEFFQLHSTKANLSTLENSFITIKKIFGSLTHRLKVTVALTETSNKFKNYLNTLPYSLPEKDIKLLTNMLSFIETFSSSPDATFHTTLKDILLEEIETIHSTPAALLLCKLFLKLSASNSIYKESSKPVISFLWKQVSTSKTYLPVVVSLLASDVVEFPLDSLQDVVDYERLVVCMKLNSFL
ncbi:U-box domain-containing protein [Entamoeba marina]